MSVNSEFKKSDAVYAKTPVHVSYWPAKIVRVSECENTFHVKFFGKQAGEEYKVQRSSLLTFPCDNIGFHLNDRKLGHPEMIKATQLAEDYAAAKAAKLGRKSDVEASSSASVVFHVGQRKTRGRAAVEKKKVEFGESSSVSVSYRSPISLRATKTTVKAQNEPRSSVVVINPVAQNVAARKTAIKAKKEVQSSQAVSIKPTQPRARIVVNPANREILQNQWQILAHIEDVRRHLGRNVDNLEEAKKELKEISELMPKIEDFVLLKYPFIVKTVFDISDFVCNPNLYKNKSKKVQEEFENEVDVIREQAKEIAGKITIKFGWKLENDMEKFWPKFEIESEEFLKYAPSESNLLFAYVPEEVSD